MKIVDVSKLAHRGIEMKRMSLALSSRQTDVEVELERYVQLQIPENKVYSEYGYKGFDGNSRNATDRCSNGALEATI